MNKILNTKTEAVLSFPLFDPQPISVSMWTANSCCPNLSIYRKIMCSCLGKCLLSLWIKLKVEIKNETEKNSYNYGIIYQHDILILSLVKLYDRFVKIKY